MPLPGQWLRFDGLCAISILFYFQEPSHLLTGIPGASDAYFIFLNIPDIHCEAIRHSKGNHASDQEEVDHGIDCSYLAGPCSHRHGYPDLKPEKAIEGSTTSGQIFQSTISCTYPTCTIN